jgi:hypothetical protein
MRTAVSLRSKSLVVLAAATLAALSSEFHVDVDHPMRSVRRSETCLPQRRGEVPELQSC